MRYESKITVLPNREVVVVTGEEPRRYEDLPEPELLNPREYRYSSVEELRKSLVRQKFHAEIAANGSNYIQKGGIALMIAAGVDLFPTSLKNQIAVGGAGIVVATVIFDIMEARSGRRIKVFKDQVDSRVKAFNETCPDSKPMTFSPRDYLSTLRLPFRR